MKIIPFNQSISENRANQNTSGNSRHNAKSNVNFGTTFAPELESFIGKRPLLWSKLTEEHAGLGIDKWKRLVLGDKRHDRKLYLTRTGGSDGELILHLTSSKIEQALAKLRETDKQTQDVYLIDSDFGIVKGMSIWDQLKQVIKNGLKGLDTQEKLILKRIQEEQKGVEEVIAERQRAQIAADAYEMAQEQLPEIMQLST